MQNITSRRTLRAMAMFGLTLEHDRHQRAALVDEQLASAAEALDGRLGPGGIALITGPSGGGKSTLLRLFEQRAARAGHARPIVRAGVREDDRSLIDLVPGKLTGKDGALRRLAAAGLADATLLARTPAELSDGQRFRLALARGMALAQRRPVSGAVPTLVIDEFCSSLDRLTARDVARTLRRWVDRPTTSPRPVRVVAATAHDDLALALAPDVVVHIGLDRKAEVRG
jgi:uncharacterized protein